MTPATLLQALEDLGAVLTPHPDGALRCKAPHGALTHVLRADLRQHKAALVALLEAREERAVLTAEAAAVKSHRGVGGGTATPATHPAEADLATIPQCPHDALWLEWQRQTHTWVCWKCVLLTGEPHL